MKRIKFSVIFFLVICLTVSGRLLAQEEKNNFFRPYGNLFVFFGFRQSESYNSAEQKEIDKDTYYNINENSNVGINFSYEGYKGVIELGLSDSEDGRKVMVRKAYGVYNFQYGELLIGQTWTPYTQWSHEAANYYRSKGFGALYDNLTTQLKITSFFGLYVDIIKPYVGTETYYINEEVNPESSSDPLNDEYKIKEVNREITSRQSVDDIQALIPKIAIGYDYKNNIVATGLGIAGNIYKIDETDDVRFNKDWLISYLAYLYTQVEYNGFSFNMSGGFSVNPANFGLYVQSSGNDTYYGGAAARVYNIATGEYEIKDTWNIQVYTELGWEFMRNAIAHVGYGFSVTDYPVENSVKDYAMEYYFNVKFNIANLIALTPSVSYRDYMRNMERNNDGKGKEEGNDVYIGILATVSFY